MSIGSVYILTGSATGEGKTTIGRCLRASLQIKGFNPKIVEPKRIFLEHEGRREILKELILNRCRDGAILDVPGAIFAPLLYEFWEFGGLLQRKTQMILMPIVPNFANEMDVMYRLTDLFERGFEPKKFAIFFNRIEAGSDALVRKMFEVAIDFAQNEGAYVCSNMIPEARVLRELQCLGDDFEKIDAARKIDLPGKPIRRIWTSAEICESTKENARCGIARLAANVCEKLFAEIFDRFSVNLSRAGGRQ